MVDVWVRACRSPTSAQYEKDGGVRELTLTARFGLLRLSAVSFLFEYVGWINKCTVDFVLS